MYSLASISQSLRGLLSGAADPNVQVTVTYHEVNQITKTDLREYPRAPQFSSIADTTEVTILDAPAQVGIFRHVDNITVYNADNANATVTIFIDDGNNRILVSQLLTPSQTMCYEDGMGWFIL